MAYRDVENNSCGKNIKVLMKKKFKETR